MRMLNELKIIHQYDLTKSRLFIRNRGVFLVINLNIHPKSLQVELCCGNQLDFLQLCHPS